MFEKRVSQSERRIRNSHVTSTRILEHRSVPIPIAKCITLALESAHTPKAHDNRSELRNKRHRADSALSNAMAPRRAGAREGLGT